MKIFKFLLSKTFFLNLILAIVITVVISFITLSFLDHYTDHDNVQPVPKLKGLSTKKAKELLENKSLRLVLKDTIEFNSKYAPFSIIEQNPKANENVKKGRKIYVKINAGNYSFIKIPPYQGGTFRQISRNLESLGLKIGDTTYSPDVAKDVVKKIKFKRKLLKAGDSIRKTSKVDFILGDGKKQILLNK